LSGEKNSGAPSSGLFATEPKIHRLRREPVSDLTLSVQAVIANDGQTCAKSSTLLDLFIYTHLAVGRADSDRIAV